MFALVSIAARCFLPVVYDMVNNGRAIPHEKIVDVEKLGVQSGLCG